MHRCGGNAGRKILSKVFNKQKAPESIYLFSIQKIAAVPYYERDCPRIYLF